MAMSAPGGVVRRRILASHLHVLRATDATDATSLSAQAQSSQTKTKERPALLLKPGIPTADNMTLSSWVHFPLPSSPFQRCIDPAEDKKSPLKLRRHRWATLYYGTQGQWSTFQLAGKFYLVAGAGGEPGGEVNHVCVLHFEDDMDSTHVTGGQGTRTGAQFGHFCYDSTADSTAFKAFEAGNGETQRHISGLSDGWHLVTLVTSPHQDSLFVDGTVLPPVASTTPSSLHASCTACCTVLGQGASRRAVSDHGDRRHTTAGQELLPAALHCHRSHHRISPDEHGGRSPR